MKADDVLLGEKDYLNTQEAIIYWNLSNRKFREFLKKKKRCKFIFMYRTRRFIIRSEFEKYLKRHPDVKEELTNGEPNKQRQ